MDSTSLDSKENAKVESYPVTSFGPGKLYLIIGIIVGILLAIGINGFITNRPYTYQGSLIDPPRPARDFRLNDQNGDTFILSQHAGSVVLLFFGYTHCPDVCPVTLYEYKRISEALGERSNQVRFVFITVDPERDTPEMLKEHISRFDPAIIGLSGDRSVLEKVWNDYGITQVKREVDSSAEYLVDHTARVYVVDKKGLLRMTFPFGFESEKMIEDINHLLLENEG